MTGFIYPLVVTGIGQVAFPDQAAGSLIVKDGKAIGSRLIGQSFSDPKYFWSRPSATAPLALQRERLHRLESGSPEPGTDRRRQGAHRRSAGGRPGQHGARSRSIW